MTTRAVPPLPDFPDAELIATLWLASNGFNAAGVMPSKPTRPNIVVTRVGGSPAVKWAVDTARLQVDVWGTSKQQARDCAASAMSALYVMPGQAGAAQGAFVSDVDVSLGLLWQPDDAQNPPIPRYLFEVAVTLRSLITT
jgi:hypothetical protein